MRANRAKHESTYADILQFRGLFPRDDRHTLNITEAQMIVIGLDSNETKARA